MTTTIKSRCFDLAIATLLAAGGALALPGETRAQSAVEVGRLAGNGTLPVRRQMRTFRDMRYRDLVPQQFDFSCGSAALGTLLLHGYGIRTSEKELIEAMMKGNDPSHVVQNGFSMLDMKRYVQSIGMTAHGFKIEPSALYHLQMPVIALLDLKGYKHFVLVKGADAGRVFVADPALGHRVMREDEFVAGWNGVVLAVIGDRPLRRDSFLVSSKRSPALQRRMEALDRATTPPRVVELGLVYTDLF
jgi:predicted double-glycine peptidase